MYEKFSRRMIVQEALKYIDYPSINYVTREQGRTPDGFDCSGFITFLLEAIKFPLLIPLRHCNEYFDLFGVIVHEGLHEGGDFVFFSRNGHFPTHMGIMLSREEYIHAPGKEHTVVTISRLMRKEIGCKKDSPFQRLYRANPIGFKRPAIKHERFHSILPP